VVIFHERKDDDEVVPV